VLDRDKRLLSFGGEEKKMFCDIEIRRNDFSLSVRDGDTVKHYRIRQLDEGGFFIARRTTFRTLQELVPTALISSSLTSRQSRQNDRTWQAFTAGPRVEALKGAQL
jgi:hypothetical protein